MTETSKNQGFYAKVHEVAIQCMTEGVITSSALGLYVFLVSQSKTFNISKAWVCKNGVSKSTLHRLEKQLVDAGLLRVNPGKGGRRSTIYIPVRYADIENGDMPLGSYCSNMARFKSIPYQNGTATVPKSTGVPYQNGTLLIITNNILTVDTIYNVDTVSIVEAWLTEVNKYDTLISFENASVSLKWQNYQNRSEGLFVSYSFKKKPRPSYSLGVHGNIGLNTDFKGFYAPLFGIGANVRVNRIYFGPDYGYNGDHYLNLRVGANILNF